jgi:DNA-binding PucR family transcriptional regulator
MDGMDAAVDAVVTEVARAVEAELPALTDEMTGWFTEVIPEFRHDETVRKLMVASTAANLAAIVDLLSHSIPLDQIPVPPAAGEYARRFAQHSLSLEALLRAYRLGENRFMRWCIDALDRMPGIPTKVALAAVQELSGRTSSYIDNVIEGLIGIYETERQRWTSRAGAARAAQIRLVLESDTVSEDAAENLLGVPLNGWHTAAVAWLPADRLDSTEALQAAVRLLQQVTGRELPLTLLADERTLWAWVQHPTPAALDLARLRERVTGGLRVALGPPGRGLAGFRGTLRDAIRARAVAEAAGGTVVTFDDVAIAGLLTEQSDDLRRWIARVLGDLAADDPATRQLRDTVRVFLEAGGSYTHAAAQLHLHKNTVHYRVRKAEELRGRPLTENRLAVEVALLATSMLRS